MTISERIFDRIRQLGISQKVFSEKTGISQSTISEWKSKGTNPTSEKIMIICEVLGVTPEWLLSGTTAVGNRSNAIPWYVVDRETDLGFLIEEYQDMNSRQRERLMGYLEALRDLK